MKDNDTEDITIKIIRTRDLSGKMSELLIGIIIVKQQLTSHHFLNLQPQLKFL
jgi:hypothetical protein